MSTFRMRSGMSHQRSGNGPFRTPLWNQVPGLLCERDTAGQVSALQGHRGAKDRRVHADELRQKDGHGSLQPLFGMLETLLGSSQLIGEDQAISVHDTKLRLSPDHPDPAP